MKILLISSAILTFSAMGAAAQSPSPNWDWSGGYVALTVGGTSGEVTDFTLEGRDANGATLGVAAGFSQQLRNRPDLVYGGDFEFNLANGGEKRSCSDADFDCEASAKTFGSVRAHIGKVQGNSMVFLNAGLAFGTVNTKVKYVGPDTGVNGDSDISLQGGVIGAGFETRLNRRMNMRFDLSQYIMPSKNVNIAGTTQDKVGFKGMHIRFGVVSRF